MDCETAVLLRAHLAPHLSAAESWADLVHRLSTKKLQIVLRAGQPAVVEVAGGGELCSLAFLGHDIEALRRRFGRPVVAPMPGRAGAGIIRG